MSYTDDAVKAKLSALNESQESIVTVAQWIMFHRRYADRTASLWLQRLKDSGAAKRLNLIYLANEVVQQSKARKREDFLFAFSPIIAEATATAYKGAVSEVQAKIRRVVEVWRQRLIFEQPIQEAVEARINEIDKARSSGKKQLLGGNLFSSPSGPSAPTELQPLVAPQVELSKAKHAVSTTLPTAKADYDKLMDPWSTTPPPPVYVARLNALLKSLASAESAVEQSIKARRELIVGLEKLLETNRVALTSEEADHSELSGRKRTIENKKRDVEDSIMRGLASDAVERTPRESQTNGSGDINGDGLHPDDLDRPEIEELTPPPVESITPVGSPSMHVTTITGGDNIPVASLSHDEPEVSVQPGLFPATAGADLLSSLTPARAFSQSGIDGENSAAKRVKVHDDPFEPKEDDATDGGGMHGLDEDVEELLRAESGGQ